MLADWLPGQPLRSLSAVLLTVSTVFWFKILAGGWRDVPSSSILRRSFEIRATDEHFPRLVAAPFLGLRDTDWSERSADGGYTSGRFPKSRHFHNHCPQGAGRGPRWGV
jgi:hypothetical protein